MDSDSNLTEPLPETPVRSRRNSDQNNSHFLSRAVWQPLPPRNIVSGTNSMPRIGRQHQSLAPIVLRQRAGSRSPNRQRPVSLQLPPCSHCFPTNGNSYHDDARYGYGACDSYHNGMHENLPYNYQNIYHRKWDSPDGMTNGARPDRLGEAVKLLENQRNHLQMQLTLLSDQVNNQAEKIQELEDLLSERTGQLESTEALLQEEMLSRSSLETHKLDLLAEVTDMRAQMLATRKEMLKKSQSGSESGSTHDDSAARLDREIKQNNLTMAAQIHIEAEQDRLRKTVELLTAALEDKDRRIRDLQLRLNAQEKDGSSNFSEHHTDIYEGSRKPPYVARPSTGSSPRRAHPLSLAHQPQNNSTGSDDSLSRYVESVSQLSDGNGVSTSSRVGNRRELESSRSSRRSRSSDARTLRSTNRELANWRSGSFRSPSISSSKSMGDRIGLATVVNRNQLRNDSIGSQYGEYQDINRCSSVPNLGRLGSESDKFRCSFPNSGTSDDKKHGIRKFFEKFTKAGSSEKNENDKPPHFKRGGIRATAGARLQHSHSSHRKKWDPKLPLQNWSHEMVIQWFEEIQIPLTRSARAWIVNGDQISKAPLSEVEKELNITNPLTKKKFVLALKAAESNDKHPMGKWDFLWVLRWLDDVGLPQYKDVFAEARVDGRTLNYITTDDLFQLKITNAIHHASIAQGIQVLRSCNYDPTCIRRRAIKPENPLESPETVIFWSNHRIMEWLRYLDLAEYGPNLRGSGVHGALMILENRFNADILADLLSIPQSKTLLRRHLNKSFVELVGSEMIRQKRAAEAAPGFVPLSPHLKLKNRKGFTLVRKHAKPETEDHVCPLDSVIDFYLLGASPDQEADSSGKSSESHKSASASPVLKPSLQNAVSTTSSSSLQSDLKMV